MRHTTMRWVGMGVVVGAMAAGFSAGCQQDPAPPRVDVPPPDGRDVLVRHDVPKPLPLPEAQLPPGARPLPPAPFEDQPLVVQQMPETRAFIEAYQRVGRPRIVLFVNRTLQGEALPVNPADPVAGVQVTRRSTTGVAVEQEQTTRDDWRQDTQRTERFETSGPGQYSESVDLYLRPGQYDEAQARALDYEAIETILTDGLSADGRTTLVSPLMARQRLTDEQVKALESGRPQALSELVRQLDADVLVHVRARPTKQTGEGLHIRVVAEAINTRGGESIARAVVDVPPPLQKTTLNRYTRFLARKLMDGMIQSWNVPEPAAPVGPASAPAQ